MPQNLKKMHDYDLCLLERVLFFCLFSWQQQHACMKKRQVVHPAHIPCPWKSITRQRQMVYHQRRWQIAASWTFRSAHWWRDYHELKILWTPSMTRKFNQFFIVKTAQHINAEGDDQETGNRREVFTGWYAILYMPRVRERSLSSHTAMWNVNCAPLTFLHINIVLGFGSR